MNKYFAQTDGYLQYLGEFTDWFAAEEASPPATVWVLDETEAKQWYQVLAQHCCHEKLPA